MIENKLGLLLTMNLYLVIKKNEIKVLLVFIFYLIYLIVLQKIMRMAYLELKFVGNSLQILNYLQTTKKYNKNGLII